MFIFESEPGKLKRRVMETAVTKPITRTPKYLNSDTEELNETRFHSMIKFENNLFRILVDTGATHSYVGKELLEKISSLNYPISKPTSQSNGSKRRNCGNNWTSGHSYYDCQRR